MLKQLWSAEYGRLGCLFGLRAIEAPASNQHYEARTASGRFFVKVVADPDALYGGEGFQRLAIVSRAVHELGAAGLPIEAIVAADRGDFVVRAGQAAVRVFHWLNSRPFVGGKDDLMAIASVLGRFHSRGLGALTPETTADLISIARSAYDLEPTRDQIGEIQEFVQAKISVKMGVSLFEAKAATHELPVNPGALVHNDAHPGNVMFGQDGAVTLIDFDSLNVGPVAKCAAFSILRCSIRMPADRNPISLSTATAEWLQHYSKESSLDLSPSILWRWMLFLELEKIVRIARRAMVSEKYEHFLGNISERHFPNLQFLLSV